MFHDGDFGTLTAEQRQIVLSKPFWRMRWFAELLGWRGLRLCWLRLGDEMLAFYKLSAEEARFYWPGLIQIYYETTDYKFKLQINEQSPQNPCRYLATAGLSRYRITLSDWYPFEFFENDVDLAAEAERLRRFLDRQQFRNPRRRARLKKNCLDRSLDGNRGKRGKASWRVLQ